MRGGKKWQVTNWRRSHCQGVAQRFPLGHETRMSCFFVISPSLYWLRQTSEACLGNFMNLLFTISLGKYAKLQISPLYCHIFHTADQLLSPDFQQMVRCVRLKPFAEKEKVYFCQMSELKCMQSSDCRVTSATETEIKHPPKTKQKQLSSSAARRCHCDTDRGTKDFWKRCQAAGKALNEYLNPSRWHSSTCCGTGIKISPNKYSDSSSWGASKRRCYDHFLI